MATFNRGIRWNARNHRCQLVIDDDGEKEAVHIAAGIRRRPAAVAQFGEPVHRAASLYHGFREINGRGPAKVVGREPNRVQRRYLATVGVERVAVLYFPKESVGGKHHGRCAVRHGQCLLRNGLVATVVGGRPGAQDGIAATASVLYFNESDLDVCVAVVRRRQRGCGRDCTTFNRNILRQNTSEYWCLRIVYQNRLLRNGLVAAIIGGRPGAQDGIAATASNRHFTERNRHVVVAVVRCSYTCRDGYVAALRRSICWYPNENWRNIVRHRQHLRGRAAVPGIVGGRPGADDGLAGCAATTGFVEGERRRGITIVGGRQVICRRRDWRSAIQTNIRWHIGKHWWHHVRQGDCNRLTFCANIAAGVRGRPGAGQDVATGDVDRAGTESDGQVIGAVVLCHHVWQCGGRRLPTRQAHVRWHPVEFRRYRVRHDDREEQAVHVSTAVGGCPAAGHQLQVAVVLASARRHPLMEGQGRRRGAASIHGDGAASRQRDDLVALPDEGVAVTEPS